MYKQLRTLFARLRNANFDDEQRILRAFPSSIHGDVQKLLPLLPFSRRSVVLADGRAHILDNLVSEFHPIEVFVRTERVEIPYRIYLDELEPDIRTTLTDTQRVIADCIYLRHHNGHVRQKHLENLIGVVDYFVTPFVIQLIGEYVLEILDVVEELMTPSVLSDYAEFINDNPFFWKRTQSRMVSYWDVYYRHRYPEISSYVGKRLVDRLNLASRVG